MENKPFGHQEPDSKTREFNEDELFSTANSVTEADSSYIWGIAGGLLLIFVIGFCKALASS